MPVQYQTVPALPPSYKTATTFACRAELVVNARVLMRGAAVDRNNRENIMVWSSYTAGYQHTGDAAVRTRTGTDQNKLVPRAAGL